MLLFALDLCVCFLFECAFTYLVSSSNTFLCFYYQLFEPEKPIKDHALGAAETIEMCHEDVSNKIRDVDLLINNIA